jgi:fatty-acyl-CoA synthase
MLADRAEFEANKQRFARQMAARRIHDLLAGHAAAIPDLEAAVDGTTRLTHAELAARVDAIAAALVGSGVKPGDRVAILTPPALDFWLSYLATTSIGAIWMGLNPRYQVPEYAYLLEDSAPTLVFAVADYDGRSYLTDLQAAGPKVSEFVSLSAPVGRAISWDEFLARGALVSADQLAARRAAVDPEDIAVIVYTSGTTGKPKGAMLSHRAIVSIAQTNLCWMADGLESTVSVAPINHVGALNNVCMNVFAYGGRIIFHHRVDLPELAEISRVEKPSYLVASPTAFVMFAANPEQGGERMRHYRLIVFGGAKTAEPLLAPIAAQGMLLSNVYGQTETCGIVTSTVFGASTAIMSETICKPLLGADLRIARADGSVADIGETGEIQVFGPYCMSGYFNRPEATAEAFTADGWLRTGDLGCKRTDGNFEFVGRLKEMYKSGGYNIYPIEIELALADHPGVAASAVLPVDHPVFQEVGHAFVEAKAGVSLSADELRDFLKPRLANYKIPKSFSFGTLPLLPNSKIDKQALKAKLATMVEKAA